MIKYHKEGSACRIENIRLDKLKTRSNLYEIEDDIEEDREGRSKDKMDEKFLIKLFPNANIFLDLILIKVYIHLIKH